MRRLTVAASAVVLSLACAVAYSNYVIKDGTGATQTVVSDTVGGNIQPVSATVDASGNHVATAPGVANANAALAVQGVSGGIAVPVTSTQLPTNAGQGSTTSGQTGPLVQGAVTTSAPSYSTGQTDPLSLTTAGALRVDNSAVTQPTNLTGISGNAPVTGGVSGILGVGGAVASAASNAGNPVKIGGAFNTTQPTVSSGQIVDAQMSSRGAQIVAIGADGFSPTISQQPTGDGQAAAGSVAAGNQLYNGSSWDRQRAQVGTTGVAAVDTESTKATYHQSALLAVTTTAGDIFIIQGSGTKTVRLRRVAISGTLTTGAVVTALLVRRSSAASSGTTGSADTISKLDGNNAAATAAVTVYTTGPTVGTNAGILRRENVFIPASTAAGPALIWDFGNRNDQAAVIRGTSDWIAINLSSGVTGAGSSISISVEWTEE